MPVPNVYDSERGLTRAGVVHAGHFTQFAKFLDDRGGLGQEDNSHEQAHAAYPAYRDSYSAACHVIWSFLARRPLEPKSVSSAYPQVHVPHAYVASPVGHIAA